MTPKVVGFVCDWAVATAEVTDTAGRLKAHPSVVIIRIPCSGFVRPSWLEDALKAGADGVFVVGCPYGDCLNREGNYLMRDRVDQLLRRLVRRKVDPARLTMMAHGLHDIEAFLAEVGSIVERLTRIGPQAGPARPASAPAPAAGQPRPAGAASGAVPAEEGLR